MTIAGFAPAVSTPVQAPVNPSILPKNNAVPFTRGNIPSAQPATPSAIPKNNAVPFTRGNIPSAAKPLTLTPAAAPAAATPGAAAVAGVAGAGFIGGAAIGELARRELVDQGFDNLQYPSNTGELLRDPIGTTIDGVNQTARDLADFFNPQQDPKVNEGNSPEFLQQEEIGDPPFQGGQGEGVAYQARFSFAGEESFSSVIYGPIQSVSIRETFPGSPAVALRIRGFNSSGRATTVTAATGSPDNINFIGLQRSDGLPDTDGDPPGQVTAIPLPKTSSVPVIQSPEFAPQPLTLPRTAPTTAPAAPASTPFPIPPAIPLALPSLPTGAPTGAPAGVPASSPQSQPGNLPQLQPGSSGQTQRGPTSTNSPVSTPRNTPQPLPQPQPQQQTPRGVAAPPFAGCDPCLTAALNGPSQPNTPEGESCTPAEICKKLEEIKTAIGFKDFPLNHPLLTGEGVGGQKNLVELIEWSVKNIDATNGHWPLEVEVLGADSKTKKIKLKDQAEAIHELFGLLFTVAEDADAAVNIASRNIVETIQTKVSTIQTGKWIKAIARFLGFNTKATKDQVRISVSPGATGPNNKLENQEIAAFLKPSSQLFEGVEYNDSKQLLVMLERMLEDVEIARAALYKPLKRDKRRGSTLTGEGMRREGTLSGSEIYEEEWDKYIQSLKKRDIPVDEKKAKTDS